ncbi:MAG: sugar ABC transporter ATP-binding protein [Synergistaceae bacterium]|jgi:ABC-type sugar transport system ATPase subunit|nr:sugar ABC transporter ATP-binding protein [Synergistaceae bacterium]
MSDSALRVEGIRKEFPGVVALDDIHFEVKRGEVHALLGENGAGKSTLIKILSGIYQPDAGRIFIGDEPVSVDSVQVARAYGISVIHQELSLARNMSIAENIFLGRFPAGRLSFVDEDAMWEKSRRLLDSIGLVGLDPAMRVSNLSVAQQQMIEICRSLSENTKILIMDEPTASLAAAEVDTLLDMMRSLRKQGVTIIFISHKLREIYRVCDKITVLRDGKFAGTGSVSELQYDDLINMMVGRDFKDTFPERKSQSGEVFFSASGIRSKRVHEVSFELRKGEVLGFYGLMGSGRSEVMRALLGIDAGTVGNITLNGKQIAIRSPIDAIKAGIALAPEDRKLEGLILKQTIDFNITLPIIGRLIKWLRLDQKLNDEIVDSISKRLRIKTASYESKTLNLSGGNQQKAVLAKWLVTDPQILILDEPTRGIDVGAKQEIYKLIYEIVGMGVGIILISSEMPEVINLCDRVYVLREGRLTGVVDRTELTEQNIMALAIGGIGA